MNRAARQRLEERLSEMTNEIKEVKNLLKHDEQQSFVVVTFAGNSKRYTYEVNAPCKIGDYCLVYARDSYQLVKVVALGRGVWPFPTKLAKRIGSAAWVHDRLVDVRQGDTVAPETALVTDGTYRVVCAHVEERTSRATGRMFWMATHVVIGPGELGALLYQPLMDHGPATWIWEDADVQHPKDLRGRQLFADVRQEQYEGQRRMKVGKLLPIEVERDDTDEDPFRGSDL